MTKLKKKKYSVYITREMTVVAIDEEEAIKKACKLLKTKKEWFHFDVGEIDLGFEKMCGRGLYKNDPSVNNPNIIN